jgi:hypothetical protein
MGAFEIPVRRGFFLWGAEVRALAVDFLAMANLEKEHNEVFVSNSADQSVLAHSISPELSEFGSIQRLTDVARVIEFCQPLLNELHDSFGMLRIKVLKLPRCRRGNLNRAGHIALSASLEG